MAAYSYKEVAHRADFAEAKKRWEEVNGESDDDPNYDGHNWYIAAQLLNEKDARIKELEADQALGAQLCAILGEHVGEVPEEQVAGAGAVEVLKRLLREHKCPVHRNTKSEDVKP